MNNLFSINIEKLRKQNNHASWCAIRLIDNLNGIELEKHHWPIIQKAALMLSKSEIETQKWHNKYISTIQSLRELV